MGPWALRGGEGVGGDNVWLAGLLDLAGLDGSGEDKVDGEPEFGILVCKPLRAWNGLGSLISEEHVGIAGGGGGGRNCD
jgi:hypothetical protein